jgi:anhydro-N-acetylmuramic acid kinase
MDRDGERAARGTVIEDLLAELLAHPFLRLDPPKSTGREEFGEAFADEVIARAQSQGAPPDDVLATLTKYTAASIAGGIRRFADPAEVVVSGGGRHNAALMRFLGDELHGIDLFPSDRLGLPGDAKEGLAFAVLANQTLRGLPGNLPSCTGARRDALLGSITPGENYRELMAKLWS